jgi:hypothetical protein
MFLQYQPMANPNSLPYDLKGRNLISIPSQMKKSGYGYSFLSRTFISWPGSTNLALSLILKKLSHEDWRSMYLPFMMKGS